jgi:hypothetical protein
MNQEKNNIDYIPGKLYKISWSCYGHTLDKKWYLLLEEEIVMCLNVVVEPMPLHNPSKIFSFLACNSSLKIVKFYSNILGRKNDRFGSIVDIPECSYEIKS